MQSLSVKVRFFTPGFQFSPSWRHGWRANLLWLPGAGAGNLGINIRRVEEILQLIGGKHPIIYSVSTIQGGAGFRWPIHSMWVI